MARNHPQRIPEDLSKDAWGSGSQNEYCCCNLGSFGLAIGRNHGLSNFFSPLVHSVAIACRFLDIQARDDHRAILNVVLSVLDQ
jgi:hypothetical protein